MGTENDPLNGTTSSSHQYQLRRVTRRRSTLHTRVYTSESLISMAPQATGDGHETLLRRARDRFVARFGRAPVAAASAPGRVNLIGDHIDYCDGFVLPAALQFSTLVVGGYNGSSECQILSMTEGGQELETSFKVTVLQPGQPAWANYVKGVVANFPAPVEGFDAVVVSTVPMGAGVSSSAALEVATFTFLEALTGRQIEPVKKALACQKAEHDFAGMPCGIMDQFVSTMARKGHALLIDCKSLQSTHIPLKSDEVTILVTNSNVKHQLTGSEYPQRRQQCQQAATLLGRGSLRGATLDDLEELKRLKADKLVLKRAEHVITEIIRTEEATACLAKGDFKRVGELFFESHTSLSRLMEVSCPELDELVEVARSGPGVLGSRMTGGGFGGCTVTLVKKEHVEQLKTAITTKYRGTPTFFLCQPSDGARILKLQ